MIVVNIRVNDNYGNPSILPDNITTNGNGPNITAKAIQTSESACTIDANGEMDLHVPCGEGAPQTFSFGFDTRVATGSEDSTTYTVATKYLEAPTAADDRELTFSDSSTAGTTQFEVMTKKKSSDSDAKSVYGFKCANGKYLTYSSGDKAECSTTLDASESTGLPEEALFELDCFEEGDAGTEMTSQVYGMQSPNYAQEKLVNYAKGKVIDITDAEAHGNNKVMIISLQLVNSSAAISLWQTLTPKMSAAQKTAETEAQAEALSEGHLFIENSYHSEIFFTNAIVQNQSSVTDADKSAMRTFAGQLDLGFLQSFIAYETNSRLDNFKARRAQNETKPFYNREFFDVTSLEYYPKIELNDSSKPSNDSGTNVNLSWMNRVLMKAVIIAIRSKPKTEFDCWLLFAQKAKSNEIQCKNGKYTVPSNVQCSDADYTSHLTDFALGDGNAYCSTSNCSELNTFSYGSSIWSGTSSGNGSSSSTSGVANNGGLTRYFERTQNSQYSTNTDKIYSFTMSLSEVSSALMAENDNTVVDFIQRESKKLRCNQVNISNIDNKTLKQHEIEDTVFVQLPSTQLNSAATNAAASFYFKTDQSFFSRQGQRLSTNQTHHSKSSSEWISSTQQELQSETNASTEVNKRSNPDTVSTYWKYQDPRYRYCADGAFSASAGVIAVVQNKWNCYEEKWQVYYDPVTTGTTPVYPQVSKQISDVGYVSTFLYTEGRSLDQAGGPTGTETKPYPFAPYSGNTFADSPPASDGPGFLGQGGLRSAVMIFPAQKRNCISAVGENASSNCSSSPLIKAWMVKEKHFIIDFDADGAPNEQVL